MSGLGSRFLKEGYKLPKPLIKVDDKEIISHVLNIFPEIYSVLFICNEEHLNNQELNLRNKLNKLHNNVQIISIKPHKKGPIYAVLQAFKFIRLDMATIVNYCDFFCLLDFKKFKQALIADDPDGCIFTYSGFHPHMLGSTNYAYVKKNKGLVIDVQEKKPFTSEPMEEEASSGSYYFRTGSIMRDCFIKTISKDLNLNGEYYVSMSYKIMLEEKKKINTFKIDHFMQWGTPADLEEYQWYSNLFKSLVSKTEKVSSTYEGCLMIPMAGEGSRFSKNGYKKPKPLIEVSGLPMFKQAVDDMPRSKTIKFLIRSDVPFFNQLKKSIKEEYQKSELKILKGSTLGQADTCFKGLKGLDLNEPLTISACDMGVIYDEKIFASLMNNNSIDVIVWGCRKYPGAIKNPSMYGWVNEEDKLVNKIFVKKVFKNPKTDPCIIGTFTYKKAEDFMNSSKLLFKNNNLVNGEFYVDSVINESISLGLNVVFMEVDYFLCWGTPNDLKTFNYWQECFDKWDAHPYQKILDKKFKHYSKQICER